MSRFVAEEGELVEPGTALPLVTTKRLLAALGVRDAPVDEQREAVATWLRTNEPNEVLTACLRREGFLSPESPNDSATAGTSYFDIFVSFSHLDSVPVRSLVAALRDRGLAVWMYETDVADHESITRAIVQGLARSKALLAYYSTSYPRSRPCQWELTAAFLAAQREGQPERRVLVVNPEEGRPDHIHPVELRDAKYQSAPDLGDARALGDLAARLDRHVANLKGTFGEIPVLVGPRWVGMRGASSARFVGRLPKLWEVHSALHQADASVVTGTTGPALAQLRGLGGVGKSLLAEEYALRFGAAFPGGVFWLRAGDEEGTTVEQREKERRRQLRALAAERGIIPKGKGANAAKAALAKYIRDRGLPCLWVVDGVPASLDLLELRQWFEPHPLAKTLLTTRSQDYGALGGFVDLGGLDIEEGYELLTKQRKPVGRDEEEAARGLVEDLGGHALALDVTGAALHASIGLQSFAEYRAALADPTEDQLELAAELTDALPNGHEKSIAATLLRSIDRLGEEGRDVLRLASVLAAAPVPASLVVSVFTYADGLTEVAATRRAVKGRTSLDRLSLAEPVAEPEGARTVHPLVLRTVRFAEGESERRQALRLAAVQVLRDQLRAVLDLGGYRSLQAEVVHARELVRQPDEPPVVGLVNALAQHDLQTGAYQKAEALWRRGWEATKELLGPEHHTTRTVQNHLATTLLAQGDARTARNLQKEVVNAMRELRGERHPETLMARHDLALILVEEDKLPRGFEILDEVLFQMRQNPGTKDARTLNVMSSLAAVLHRLGAGHLPLARTFAETAHDMAHEVLGKRHSITLTAANVLAGVQFSQGEITEARIREQKVLDAIVQEFGEDHPDSLTTMFNLAALYRAEGNLDKAHELEKRSSSIGRRRSSQ